MSKMPWLRLYSRIIDDPKLKLLAFEDRWHFVALLCLKSDGLIDEPDSDLRSRKIAVALGVQVRELEEIGRRLREVELVDLNLNPCKWDDLQFKSDTSTARVQAYRKKQGKQERNTVKRSGNVTETVQEEDTEQSKIEPKGSCASGDTPEAKPELKAQHLVDEWNLTAKPINLPCVRDLTPARRQLCRQRIAQYELADFVDVFGKVRSSPFLRGEKNWKGATFDWALKRENFQKILEGNYDE